MLLYENIRLRRDWTAENHSTYIQMQLPPEGLHQLLSEQSQPLLNCVLCLGKLKAVSEQDYWSLGIRLWAYVKASISKILSHKLYHQFLILSIFPMAVYLPFPLPSVTLEKIFSFSNTDKQVCVSCFSEHNLLSLEQNYFLFPSKSKKESLRYVLF